MIAIENADDFEFYSANSAGGIQGYGYQCRNAGYALRDSIFWVWILTISRIQAAFDPYGQLAELVPARPRSR